MLVDFRIRESTLGALSQCVARGANFVQLGFSIGGCKNIITFDNFAKKNCKVTIYQKNPVIQLQITRSYQLKKQIDFKFHYLYDFLIKKKSICQNAPNQFYHIAPPPHTHTKKEESNCEFDDFLGSKQRRYSSVVTFGYLLAKYTVVIDVPFENTRKKPLREQSIFHIFRHFE